MPELDEFALIRLLTGRRGASAARAAGAGGAAGGAGSGGGGTEGAAEGAGTGGGETAGTPGAGVVVGVGDDAAVVRVTPGFELVLSCDTMVQEVHFKAATMTGYDVGFKALASNISDMAAMGAVPRYALVSLTVPRSVGVTWLEELYDGLYACAERFGVAVVGGDTTSSPDGVAVAVTIVGEVEAGRALLRSGAKPGDAVFVTGPLGESAAGLDFLLRRGEPADGRAEVPPGVAALVRRHQRPLPQVEAGRLLLAGGACRSLNDVSDGLASEAAEIAEASGCGLLLEAAAIPLGPELREYARERGKDPLDWALYGGEDYQLVGTLEAERADEARAMLRERGLELYLIGEATADFAGVRLRGRDGAIKPLQRGGYNHFA